MRLSIYTYIFTRSFKYYLYNSESSLFAVISESLYSLLYNRDFQSIDKDTLNTLRLKKIIVEDEEVYSYYDEIKMRYYSESYDKENLLLVIVPFSGCNFACPYCFEEKKAPYLMSAAVEDKVLEFITGHPNAKKLSLTWYGGEPLLGFDVIKSLYRKIMEKTDLNILRHSLITNGYLINQEMLNFFRESKLQEMQITLDGKENNHNKTRCLKQSRQGTFERIVENIGLVLENLPNCMLSIRINVNKTNQDDFQEMYHFLHNRFPSKHLYVYPGFIREETKDKSSLCYRSIDGNTAIPFYNRIKEWGVHVNFFPKIANKGCMINRLNAYIIGPKGELYKCWNDVNNADKIIGYIDQKEFTNRTLFDRYMTEVSPFEDDKCKDCLLFPVCSGGCSWYRYKNSFEGAHFNVCSQFKDLRNLEEALLNSLSDKKDQENEKGNVIQA